MKKKLLEVKNLRIKLPSGKIMLNEVSFDVRQGDLVSLIGLNGSGKSTLLNAIIGFIKPDFGEINKYTDKIFYIPQSIDLDMDFPVTVKEMCEFFGGSDYEKYLEGAGALHLKNQQLKSLSGGELQRVLVATALSKKPDLLLLDEPTSGIDVVGEGSFYNLIQEIRNKYGIAVVLVSHDIHLVIKNATKVLCLADTKCCHGTPDEITGKEDFIKAFGGHLALYTHKHHHNGEHKHD